MNEQDRVSLREYIEAQFAARDTALIEARRTIDHRLEAMNELRDQINRERGEYAREEQLDQLRDALEGIRRDHVGRKEFDAQARAIDERRGATTAFRVAASVVATIAAVVVGLAFAAIPSNDEISAQIKTEAPWVTDKPEIDSRLRVLENKVAVNTKRIDDIEALNKFFCSTRVKANLPGCSP